MRKIALVVLAAASLSLGGCNWATVAAGVGGAILGNTAPPVTQAVSAVRLNQNDLRVANKRAKDAYVSLKQAARSGAIARSTDADVGRPNFCEMVIKDVAVVTDRGGLASALTCRIDHALDRAQGALESGDETAYATNIASAETLTDQLAEMIRIANEGVAP